MKNLAIALLTVLLVFATKLAIASQEKPIPSPPLPDASDYVVNVKPRFSLNEAERKYKLTLEKEKAASSGGDKDRPTVNQEK